MSLLDGNRGRRAALPGDRVDEFAGYGRRGLEHILSSAASPAAVVKDEIVSEIGRTTARIGG